MKHTNNIYTANKGNFFIRKEDGLIMGSTITLGDIDSIDNYIERPYTKEEYDSLYGRVV